MKVVYLAQPFQPIIWIERQPNVLLVKAVRIYMGLPEDWSEDLLPITPPISDVLYYALAGHRFATSPDTASAALARYYRALILKCQVPLEPHPAKPQRSERLQLWVSQFRLARKVVNDFGHYMQPHLGYCDPTKPGCPPHPRYEARISLLDNIYELAEIRGN